MSTRRPIVDSHFESSTPGLFIIGDLIGAPVVKIAMEQGSELAEHIARTLPNRGATPYDLIVIGAGAAGLNAALVAQDLGLRVITLEKNKIANTIEEFPEGKWVYAEPDERPPKGKLWLAGARKEELISRWHQIIQDNRLEVRTEQGVRRISKLHNDIFEVDTGQNTFRAPRVVLATGQRGTPRKLGVPGEDREEVYHWLYSPKQYSGEDILVVGGGNSAVEAALVLAGRNRVTISYRGGEFSRVFKDNRRKLQAAVEAGKIRVVFQSTVRRFEAGTCTLQTPDETIATPYQHAFVLIGAEAPEPFLRSLGVRLENDWNLRRFAWLAFCFLLVYTIYAVKQSPGFEFWPFRGWGARAFEFFHRPWSFWYTVLYTLLMTVFGLRALKRWGLDRRDRFQIWRYTSLISFQWIFFFLVPEFLFRWVVHNPALAAQSWRSYGLVYAWPLFFYTFLGNPHWFWIVWGALLSFGILPVVVLFHGKRYCSWVCGCGGLAETLGDRWRHLAPKGKASIRWERMNSLVLAAAVAVSALVLLQDTVHLFRRPAMAGLEIYHFFADIWLVGVIPLALYPFFGGKIWCRYWCPLAKLMELFSALFTRLRVSRFAIYSNEKCIACGECTRNCQVGIDVMQFALKQQPLDNSNSSCIGCGICVTVCPMDVLTFRRPDPTLVQLQVGAPTPSR